MRGFYVSDLDGTLLQNDGRLSEFTRQGLFRLMLEEVNFTIASARSVISIQKMLGDLPLRLPIIEFNGSFISDYQTGRHEIIHSLSSEIAGELYALFSERGLVPFLSTFNGKEDCLYHARIDNEGMSWYLNDRLRARDERLRSAANLKECLGDQVVCFTLIGRRAALQPLAEEVKERFRNLIELTFYENQYSPGWHWLTVHDRKATKDQAIKTLAERLELDLAKLTVFGDNANDLPMFRIAARAIAVGNAIPELKASAHEVIGTNEEDSVMKYILKELGIA